MLRHPGTIVDGPWQSAPWLCLPLLAILLGACSRPTPSRPNPLAEAATLEAAGAVATEVAIETARAGDVGAEAASGSEQVETDEAALDADAQGLAGAELGAELADSESEPSVPTADPGASLDAELAAAGLDPRNQLSLCRLVGRELADALGSPAADLVPGAADVEDAVWGTLLDGCQLALEASGADLAIGKSSDSLPERRLRKSLQAAGWKEEPDYRKLLPGETISGFLRPGALCVSHVKLKPPPGSGSCGKDDPTCGLPPASLHYEIALRCARF
jgi:hypothetical protein